MNVICEKGGGNMYYSEIEVEAIKIGVGGIERGKKNSKDILIQSVVWLVERYDATSDKQYLEKAVWHIYAYLELGYPYESGHEVFDDVLQKLGHSREELFPAKQWFYKPIILKRSNISQLLGKWNPKLQSMRIKEAVEDIINNVKECKKGTFLYHCGKIIRESEGEMLWEKTFILYVYEDEAILRDINKNKYYILKQEETHGTDRGYRR